MANELAPSFARNQRPAERQTARTANDPAHSPAANQPLDERSPEYQLRVRNLYNSSQFDQLESIANDARATKAQFANGAWKIFHVYGSLDCRHSEPEGMWLLHNSIHKAWIAAKPKSVTARIAQAMFFTAFGWRARGYEYANTVTEEGWRLFAERLKQARETLEQAREMERNAPCGGGRK